MMNHFDLTDQTQQHDDNITEKASEILHKCSFNLQSLILQINSQNQEQKQRENLYLV